MKSLKKITAMAFARFPPDRIILIVSLFVLYSTAECPPAMKRIPIIPVLLLSSCLLKAQTIVRLPDSTTTVVKSDSLKIIEIESSFPGGASAWYRFLANNLVYPPKAVRKKIQGQVIFHFIVEKDGSLSDVKIVSGPPELWQAVLDVINQSPKWLPAIQNGKKVRSYKSEPINFKLERETTKG